MNSNEMLQLNTIAEQAVKYVDPQLREDWRQEVILSLLSRPYYPEKGPFDVYFTVAAIGKVKDLKRVYMKAKEVVMDPDVIARMMVDTTWENRVVDRIVVQDVLSKMSDDYRIVFEMTVCGYSTSEIAEVVGKSVRTIQQRVRKVRDAVRSYVRSDDI